MEAPSYCRVRSGDAPDYLNTESYFQTYHTARGSRAEWLESPQRIFCPSSSFLEATAHTKVRARMGSQINKLTFIP